MPTAAWSAISTPDNQRYADALPDPDPGTQPVANGDFGRNRFRQILDREDTTSHGAEVNGRIIAVATHQLMPNMTYGDRPCALADNIVPSENVWSVPIAIHRN